VHGKWNGFNFVDAGFRYSMRTKNKTGFYLFADKLVRIADKVIEFADKLAIIAENLHISCDFNLYYDFLRV